MVKIRNTLAVIALAVLAACNSDADTSIDGTPVAQPDPAVLAGTAKKAFGAQRGASAQNPAPLGSYAKGCMAGGAQLAETGPTWQIGRAHV